MRQTRRIDLRDEGAGAAVLLCLREGGLAAVPTETVYGLAADAANGVAVASIFEAKGRPRFNPLICHVFDLAMAETYAEFDPVSRRLATRFWPGPLTLVLPVRPESGLHPLVMGGLDTVALRAPQGPLRMVIDSLGRPIAAPSANRSGCVSPTNAEHVLKTLDGRIDLVADGGACEQGLESTIIRVMDDHILLLRPGTLTAERIEEEAGLPIRRREEGDAISAPGQLLSHYAPSGRVRLDATAPEPGEYWIGFGPGSPNELTRAGGVFNLSETGDLKEAASRLFAALSAFDAPDIEAIAVAPIPDEGLGEAINDRLRRAAAER
ncbi:L-threonylcarbamoyladenylate synthase [Aureimonas sp. D3]|uniref:L-threonylcarbamoyladenylate synthase n=1 Tax=Aureimonas sp. D3 TaxID=1638164 RepID=UPI0007852F97|nr:L-threonylcarbamoyladenylate synthase [Aureimonas sp. D3]